jgi:hypothetical protein
MVRAPVAAGFVAARISTGTLAQEATPSSEPLFTGATFVGETSDPETYVAVVLSGESGDPSRPAHAPGHR